MVEFVTMKEFLVEGNKQSHILVGDCFSQLSKLLPAGNVVVITDDNVFRLYHHLMEDYDCIIFEPGEEHKTLSTIEDIYKELFRMKADRSTFILGFGGGLVCDVAGFVASTYMRGLRFGFVATTLLAQVDASVGGKNGVNFAGAKNMIGTFNQPEFVLCDPHFLKTLPQKEIRSGFGEIIKHALIGDREMFSYLEKNHGPALSLNKEAIEHLVFSSIEIKSAIVTQDETEKGIRRLLNFGHTFGHAIESLSEFTHGEAVAIGMVVAAKISETLGKLTSEEIEKIENLIESYGLPINPDLEADLIFDQLLNDKKREANRIHFVVLNKIGDAVIQDIKLKELSDLYFDLIQIDIRKKICVSLGNISFDDCLKAVETYPLCEIRIDLLDFTDEEFEMIFSAGERLVATYRAGTVSDQERKEMLLKAIAWGAFYVDLDLESDHEFFSEVLEQADEVCCMVIASYHNFSETPSSSELINIADRIYEPLIDYVKIACRVNADDDLKRIFSLYDDYADLVAFGMGELGTSSRAKILELGAPFTYAALDEEKYTAPGQLSFEQMMKLVVKSETFR